MMYLVDSYCMCREHIIEEMEFIVKCSQEIYDIIQKDGDINKYLEEHKDTIDPKELRGRYIELKSEISNREYEDYPKLEKYLDNFLSANYNAFSSNPIDVYKNAKYLEDNCEFCRERIKESYQYKGNPGTGEYTKEVKQDPYTLVYVSTSFDFDNDSPLDPSGDLTEIRIGGQSSGQGGISPLPGSR
jgi:hypothetical protein